MLIQKKWWQIILFILAIVLSLIFSKIVGKFSYSIFNPIIGLGPIPTCPECIDGFILSYLFFITLLLNLIKTKIYWLLFLLPIILLINPPFGFLILGTLLIIIAWLLAQIILLAYQRIRK